MKFLNRIIPAAPLSRGRGVTMAEALVVLAVFMLISLGLLSLYIQHGWLYTLGQAQFDSVGGARGALNGISAYAVQAHRVVSSTTITSTLYTTGTSTIVLELPAINASGDIINSVSDYAVFFINDNKLYRVLAPGTGSARTDEVTFLAGNLTSLAFSYDNMDLAQARKITVAVTSTAGSSRVQEAHHESGEFILRNY